MAKNIKNKIDLKTEDQLIDDILTEYVQTITGLSIKLYTGEKLQDYLECAKLRDEIKKVTNQCKMLLNALNEVQIVNQLDEQSAIIFQSIKLEFDNL